MISKTEWVTQHLGNPDELQVDAGGVIRDTVRPFDQQTVGRVTRQGGLAVVRWRVSGTTSTLPD